MFPRRAGLRLLSSIAASICVAAASADVPLHGPAARLVAIEYPAAAGADWISSETEFVAVFPLPLRALAEVLSDYTSYPTFVPNLERTTVMAPAADGPVIRQDCLFAAFGRRFESSYDLAMRQDASALPGKWVLAWKLAGSDGSVGASEGRWTLEDIGGSDGPATRVTHRNSCLVRKTFPFQDSIMRAFADRSMSKYILSVYEEARSREGRGPLASAAR